jgi:hypothetical protein
MFVSPDEIYTHLYPESIKAISGNDERLLLSALSGAISEVKLYLSKYDTEKLFGTVGDERDALLIIWVKDVAVWHYINIANPNIDYEDKFRRYQYAISSLKNIQKGAAVPDFPLKEDANGNIENTSGILIGSNPKRTQHL